MTYIGTGYFVSLRAAVAYYKPYGYGKEDVKRKVSEGEIHIGKPEGEIAYVKDGLYFIKVED